jgi:flagellin
MKTSFERLSSGLRINSARDDAAGLSIGTQMEAQTRGLQKSIQNSTDWISLLQTAEGGLEEMTNILQRIRELSVQSINEMYNDQDRASLNAEVE